MPKTKAKSLDEFAATRPVVRRAWITHLDEFDEIVAAYRNGIGPRVIYEWLKQEKGYTEADLRSYNSFRQALRDQAVMA